MAVTIDLLCIAMKCTSTSAQATRFLRAAGIGRSSETRNMLRPQSARFHPARNLRHCGSAPKAGHHGSPPSGSTPVMDQLSSRCSSARSCLSSLRRVCLASSYRGTRSGGTGSGRCSVLRGCAGWRPHEFRFGGTDDG
ncbi:hypothetical protein EHI46_22035 [Rhizobium leguminosarum]|nr:hypothetical protein EHI46_22035 [Rhizobium leguminosarum]